MDLASIRDLAIVILAVLAIIQLILTIVLSLVIYAKVVPLLESAKKTATRVQGTTAFVSDTAVKPIISTIAFATGITRALAILTRVAKRRGGR